MILRSITKPFEFSEVVFVSDPLNTTACVFEVTRRLLRPAFIADPPPQTTTQTIDTTPGRSTAQHCIIYGMWDSAVTCSSVWGAYSTSHADAEAKLWYTALCHAELQRENPNPSRWVTSQLYCKPCSALKEHQNTAVRLENSDLSLDSNPSLFLEALQLFHWSISPNPAPKPWCLKRWDSHRSTVGALWSLLMER